MGAAQGRTGLSQGIISFTVSGAACVCFELARIRANIPRPVKAKLYGACCFQMWLKKKQKPQKKTTQTLETQTVHKGFSTKCSLKPLCQCVALAHNREGRTGAL